MGHFYERSIFLVYFGIIYNILVYFWKYSPQRWAWSTKEGVKEHISNSLQIYKTIIKIILKKYSFVLKLWLKFCRCKSGRWQASLSLWKLFFMLPPGRGQQHFRPEGPVALCRSGNWASSAGLKGREGL